MKFKLVTYSKIFPTSSFLNERIGVEIEVADGGDPKEALRAAKLLAEEFNRESNPDLYKFNEVSLSSDEAAAVKAMGLCDDVKKLAQYKNGLTKNTRPYYTERLKTLTTNFTTK